MNELFIKWYAYVWNQLKIPILIRLSLHVHIFGVWLCVDVLFDICDASIKFRSIETSKPNHWMNYL